MWKWLVLIVAGYVLYRLFANDILKKKKASEEESAAELGPQEVWVPGQRVTVHSRGMSGLWRVLSRK